MIEKKLYYGQKKLEEKSESRIITWQGIRFIVTQVAIPIYHQSMMQLRFNEPLLKTLSTRTEEQSFQITNTWRYAELIIYYSCYYWQKSKKLRCFWNFWTICLIEHYQKYVWWQIKIDFYHQWNESSKTFCIIKFFPHINKNSPVQKCLTGRTPWYPKN